MLLEQAFKSIIFCLWFHLNLSITFKLENLIWNTISKLRNEKLELMIKHFEQGPTYWCPVCLLEVLYLYIQPVLHPVFSELEVAI